MLLELFFLGIGALIAIEDEVAFSGFFLVILGSVFILTSIKSIKGVKKTLQSYMSDLPYYVKNKSDVKKLFNKSGDSMLLVQKEISKALDLIDSDEPIYLMAAPTVTITNRLGVKENSLGMTPGVAFISNRRFVFCRNDI